MARKLVVFSLALLFSAASSQTKMFINKTNGTADSVWLAEIKNITFKTYPGIPSQGLIAAWLFEGNAVDATGNGNNGTVNGATLTGDRFGSANKAYAFNGGASILGTTSSLNFGSSSFAISAWVKTASPGGGGVITSHDPGASKFSNVGIYIAGSNFGFADVDINNGAGSTTNFAGRKITDNQWHHIVASRQGNIARVYVDGVLDFMDVLSQNPYSSTIFMIGSSYNTAFFTGSIDDIRIYNRALSDAEVVALYHENGW